MHLTITNKAKNVDTKTIKRATAFYADSLMRNHEKIDLYLDFEKDLQKNYKDEGWIVAEGGNRYTITLDPKFSKRKILIALAHEMVHLKQYHSRKFTYNKQNKMHRFNGKSYREGMNYWNRPWEIEAFGRELGLYRMFMEYNKNEFSISSKHIS